MNKLEQITMVKDYGKIKIKLGEVMKEKISLDTNSQR